MRWAEKVGSCGSISNKTPRASRNCCTFTTHLPQSDGGDSPSGKMRPDTAEPVPAAPTGPQTRQPPGQMPLAHYHSGLGDSIFFRRPCARNRAPKVQILDPKGFPRARSAGNAFCIFRPGHSIVQELAERTDDPKHGRSNRRLGVTATFAWKWHQRLLSQRDPDTRRACPGHPPGRKHLPNAGPSVLDARDGFAAELAGRAALPMLAVNAAACTVEHATFARSR